jgi:ribosome-binding protein aMBF1 (putative translation factor)
MEQCCKCGATRDKVKLFDAISDEDRCIVKICENCAKKEDLPIIKKPTDFQLKESERRHTVYERLSKAAGLDKDRLPTRIQPEISSFTRERSLREIVDKNFVKRVPDRRMDYPDLIDNFHWVIMRMRRSRKLTQEQLAERIKESESTVSMAEVGKLPVRYDELIHKFELFFGIKLFKGGTESNQFQSERNVSEFKIASGDKIKFNDETSRNITISDLKKMKEKKEAEIFEEEIPIEQFPEEDYVFDEEEEEE